MTFEASGKYRLDARLGGGGMAEVFVASQLGAEGFSKKVAIKRVLPGFSDNPAFAQMFVDEARITSRLAHPNIVSVHDFDRDLERRLFLVMELVEGKDLDALVSTGVLPFPVVAYVIAEVLRGLGHAHDFPVSSDLRGIVHRDVSPHNVLLSWEGAVKVSDFGIAKARAASEATASVFIKGKPSYMSPEQANGDRLDGRSDLFAVGIMLWEMLAGRRLFTGEDTRATLAAVLFGVIPRPRSLRADVPKDLDRVTMKLLERDLPARYATAEAALAELMACEVASKATREAVRTTLAERFPFDAPVRHSAARSRSSLPPASQPPAQAVAAIGPHGSTVATAPTSAAPGLQPAYAQDTALARPVGPQTQTGGSGKRIAIAAIVALVGCGIGVAIVAGTRGGGGNGSAAPIDAGAIATAKIDAGSPPPPPPQPQQQALDASVPVAIDAAAAPLDAPAPRKAIDAAVAVVQKDATAATASHAGTGTLSVESFPIGTVTIDAKHAGDTPLTGYTLAVGTHRVQVDNAEVNMHKSRQVQVVANQNTDVDFR